MTRPSLQKIRSLFYFFNFEKTKVAKSALDSLDLAAFQSVFNARLEQFLNEKRKTFGAISDTELSLATVDHVVNLIRSGGKRVRPYIMFLTYCTEGGFDQEEALRVSVALELVHSFALIHDDIIDRGRERHGIATTHEFVREITSTQPDLYPRGEKTHIGEGMAILAGDLIFSWAHEIIQSSHNQEVQKIFFRLIEEVVAGQMIDVSLMVRNEVTTADILKKNELKTALYSFVNPMLIGAALASPHGTPSSRVAFYRELGLALGNAFQIQDDLLDIIGTHDTTGKMPFIDVHDGQHTILSQYIFDHAEARDKEVFMSLFGKPVDAHGQKVLARLFESTGAIAHAEKEIAQLFSKAYALIADASMKKPQKEAWLHFVGKLDKRTS